MISDRDSRNVFGIQHDMMRMGSSHCSPGTGLTGNYVSQIPVDLYVILQASLLLRY